MPPPTAELPVTRVPLSPQDWIDAAIARHTRDLPMNQFLKAVRALSARYVERRGELPSRSPIDSAGKRAAFAGYFALLHYLTLRQILAALDVRNTPATRVLDLGCGTGVGAAAWAHAAGSATRARFEGVDQDAWVLGEARWNWHALGIEARTRRGSLVDALAPARSGMSSAVALFAWSVNELPPSTRTQTLTRLQAWRQRGGRVLVVEPLARSAVPWWDEWVRALASSPADAREWKFPPDLPSRLAEIDEAAGFRRDALSARSLWLR
jgi:hypothetical protein